MKVSLNWVRQFTDVDVSTDELVKLATERLGGIEGVTELGKHYEGIVVAKVVSCVKHPDADKLSLCKIDDGGAVKDVARDEIGYVQVVCGAPNVRKGLAVAWIPPASVVPASYGEKELFVLEARELRGQLSNGMLASPAELGINDDHSSILEIDEAVKPGTPFKKLYDLDDIILDIENKMFTHRPDGFGQLGVARELAGIQHKAFKSPDWYTDKIEDRRSKNEESSVSSPQSPILSVSVEDAGLCPRYMAVCLEDVKIKPSPIWLQSYLKRVGIRPINNVVDITNYMMVLTAQPLHAFDFDKIATDVIPAKAGISGSDKDSRLHGNDNGRVTAGGKRVDITVRRPKKGEKMTLLDGKQIEPHKGAVLICNPDGPIALGGIMGGGTSEVDENTTRVVLECATFDMYGIRKASMIHGLFTDAVTRFTKGQSAAQLPPVLYKAVQMFEELAGAKVVDEVVDSPQSPVPSPQSSGYIEVDAKFINERLGSKFSSQEVVTLLNNVEIQAHEASGPISVTPPFWRTDLEIPEDIVEEVGRLYGFNRLPVVLPQRNIAPVTPEPKRAMKQRVREILSGGGANEVLTYSFVHSNLLTKVGQKPEASYALRNALSPDLQYYRQTLTPSLLDLVHPNIKTGFDGFVLFELNKTHNKVHPEDKDGLPGELNMVALTYANKNADGAAYYHARRYLDYLGTKLGFSLRYMPTDAKMKFPVTAPFDLERSALVTIKETDIFLGIVGEYRPEVVKNLKLPSATAGFEIDLEALVDSSDQLVDSSYQPSSRYPATEQDLTLRVSSETPFATLDDCLREVLSETEYDWRLQPITAYQKDLATKNLTFRLHLTHHDRTLTTGEVTKLVEKLSEQAHEQLKAEQI